MESRRWRLHRNSGASGRRNSTPRPSVPCASECDIHSSIPTNRGWMTLLIIARSTPWKIIADGAEKICRIISGTGNESIFQMTSLPASKLRIDRKIARACLGSLPSLIICLVGEEKWESWICRGYTLFTLRVDGLEAQ